MLVRFPRVSATICAAALCVSTLAAPSAASAASNGSIDKGSSQANTEVTLTITGVVLVIATVGAGLASYGSTKNANRGAAVAALYLRQHAIQIRQDLCLGRGPILSDMTRLLTRNKRERKALRAALLAQRFTLLALAAPAKLTPKRALQFFSVVRKARLQVLAKQLRAAPRAQSPRAQSPRAQSPRTRVPNTAPTARSQPRRRRG